MKKILASSVVAVLSVAAVNFSAQDYRQSSVVAGDSLSVSSEKEIQTVDDFIKSIPTESYNTHFELTNSQYLNIKLDSSEIIEASLESVPDMVIIRLSANASASSSNITIGGFLPLTEYHKYEDDYTAHEAFITDENGNYAYTQDISKTHLIFIQPRPSTILISDDATGGDCVLKNAGVWDDATKTCTLTRNLAETVQIQNNGITLDGGGYSSIGGIPISGFGVFLNGKTGITVKNLTIRNFSYGIFAYSATDSNFINNLIESNSSHGILVDYYSSNINISGNTITSSSNGIVLNNLSSNINVSDNTVTSSIYGIEIINGANNNSITNNIIMSHSNTGLMFVNGSNNTATGNTIENNRNYGLFLYRDGADPANNKIYNNNFINNTPAQAYNKPQGGNILNLEAPIGGNYWSNWTSPDANNDRFVDNPYAFTGAIDNLPWTAKNAWLDSVAPTTTATLSGTVGENEWYISSVEVSLAAEDNADGTGIEKIEYGWDGLAWLVYSAPIVISDNSIKKIYYRATDKVNNVEITQSQNINIDTIAPRTDISLTGNLGTNGWHTSDVSAVLNSIDDSNGSGVEITEYSFDNLTWNAYSSVITVSEEGAATIFYRSKDKAGNTETTASRTVNIDKTFPVISGKITQEPNINNWYNQNVTIEFLCSDAISGAVNPIINAMIATEGAEQSSTGICIDKAGNSANYTITGINIDKTNPQVSVLRSPEANAKGWNNTAIIATFVATDSLSNIDGDSTSIVNFNLEGANQEASQTFKDKAGNKTTGTIAGINIDLAKPAISGSAAASPNTYGWYNADIAVNFSANDELSGISSVSPDIIITGEGADQEASGTAEDNAGNISSFILRGINIDKTPPVITGSPTSPANSNNWYNDNIEIEFSGSDTLSGIAEITPIVTISQEGANQSVTGTATDKAGNSALTEISGINLDSTDPKTEITLSENSKCSGSAINISLASTDTLSGIAKTEYNLDSKGWVFYAGEFGVSDAGNHALIFRAYDNADNIESAQTKSFTIKNSSLEASVKFDPVKKDIKVYNTQDGSEVDYIILPSKNNKDNKDNNDKDNKDAKHKNDNDDDDDNDDDEQGWELRKYQIEDCIDNSLSIIIKHKDEGHELKAEIVSLQYGAEPIIKARENSIDAEYSLEKNGIIKELEQNISAKNRFDIDTKYNAAKNQTSISEKLAGRREKKQIKSGMIIPEMLITNGTLKYRY